MSAPTTPAPTREQAAQEADDLIDLAQRLEEAAKATRKDAAAIRAFLRADFDANQLPAGVSGMTPGFGYAYAKSRLYTLDAWRDDEHKDKEPR